MRKFPVYCVVDCGENMHGLFQVVKKYLALNIANERLNPYSLESLYLSFISAGREFKVIKKLTHLSKVNIVNIQPINGMANIENFEEFMASVFNNDLIKKAATQKGDLAPIIYWISDGSRQDFVQRCSNRDNWRNAGRNIRFYEVNCDKLKNLPDLDLIDRWGSDPFDENEWIWSHGSIKTP
jgi:uncharacterized protein YegL